MSNLDKLTKMETEYIEKYGLLPDTQEELLEYLCNTIKIKKSLVDEQIVHIESVKWEEINFTIPVVPKPTPRPRHNTKSNIFYVKGAKDYQKIIRRLVSEREIICTRVELYIKTYQPTPNMRNHEIYLAEMGLIRPIQNPDWDNLGKTYSDMIQGYLLLNDNIICKGCVEKYFSIKPRIEIVIKYQTDYDSYYNKNKIEKSSAYTEYVESKEEK